MFTGLVEALATVRNLQRGAKGGKLSLLVPFSAELVMGESVSVNGACLTVSRIDDGGFVADVSSETLAVTTLGGLRTGQAVNVERAMKLGGRLGGHLVMGHVDAVGAVVAIEPAGDANKVSISAPKTLHRYIAQKGSVALDGVSLTVNGLSESGFDVMLVPHTLASTTLQEMRPGQALNVEVDVLSRYAARLMEQAGLLASAESSGASDAGLLSALQRGGYV